jgi:hypothetical protein
VLAFSHSTILPFYPLSSLSISSHCLWSRQIVCFPAALTPVSSWAKFRTLQDHPTTRSSTLHQKGHAPLTTSPTSVLLSSFDPTHLRPDHCHCQSTAPNAIALQTGHGGSCTIYLRAQSRSVKQSVRTSTPNEIHIIYTEGVRERDSLLVLKAISLSSTWPQKYRRRLLRCLQPPRTLHHLQQPLQALLPFRR